MSRDEHSCNGGQAEITFIRDGTVIQRWIRLCGDAGSYWGGWTYNEQPGLAHMLMTEHGMFKQIAQFAHDPTSGVLYELRGPGWATAISTRMEADRIAGPLACDPRRVRHFFALSVEVPNPDEVTV